MDERRKLARKYLIIYSRVFERTMGKLLGYLADLSPGGAMIITEEPLVEETILPLRFDLPDSKLFGAHNLSITARVARSSPDISPEFYDVGLEFLEITPEQAVTIEKMMELYEFHRDRED